MVLIDLYNKASNKVKGYFSKETPKGVSTTEPQAFLPGIRYNRVYAIPFDGEKNLGELGPINKYVLDYDALRLRSWQLYLDSEVCQTVVKRFSRWVIGTGLKPQSEPQKIVLESEGIKIDAERFSRDVESRFRVFCDMINSDYSNQRSIHAMADEAFINSKVGGDVLVILRYVNKQVTVQLIDGSHVSTPIGLSFQGTDFVAPNGNRVRNGEELDSKGNVLAYYVRTGPIMNYTYERVDAYGPRSGLKMAFMVKGLKYRMDNNRGIPLLSAVMETIKKMERYKEATVGSAEERQKISLFVEHTDNSTGENPFTERMAQASGMRIIDDIPTDINGTQLATQIAATTNKQAINLPQGATIKSIEADNELYFKDFYTVNIDLVCATVDIPPNVAMSKYDSNFSASRAALKDWEHTLSVERKKFADQFYYPIYCFWLHTQILENKIQAPGYMAAWQQKNMMAIEAYRSIRFTGANVPHIDPVKEVTAERLKLGNDMIPLTTAEAATEALNGGDYNANVRQYAREKQEAETLGIKTETNENNNNTSEPSETEDGSENSK